MSEQQYGSAASATSVSTRQYSSSTVGWERSGAEPSRPLNRTYSKFTLWSKAEAVDADWSRADTNTQTALRRRCNRCNVQRASHNRHVRPSACSLASMMYHMEHTLLALSLIQVALTIRQEKLGAQVALLGGTCWFVVQLARARLLCYLPTA